MHLKIKYKALILTINMFFIFASVGLANRETDSLEALLENVSGMDKVDIMQELIWAYRPVDPQKGLKVSEEALLLAAELDYKQGMANIYRRTGAIHRLIGSYEKALEYYMISMNLCVEIEDTLGIAKVYNNIGNLYNYLKNYDIAIQYYNKSLGLKIELGDKQGIAATENNIGIINKARGMYQEALENFNNSLSVAKEIENNSLLAQVYNNIGIVYSRLGKYDKAMRYYYLTLQIYTRIGNKIGLASVLNNIGHVIGEIGRTSDALDTLNIALKMSIEMDLKPISQTSYSTISEIYYKNKDFEKAFEFFKISTELRDSIYSEDSRQRILQLQIKHENLQSRKEIDLLKKNSEGQKAMRNYLIVIVILVLIVSISMFSLYLNKKKSSNLFKKQNDELEKINEKLVQSEKGLKQLNSTKDKFFSIIAHDLKNPINSFSQGLELLMKEFDYISKDDMLASINEINISADHLFVLLENLLQWSRAQTGRIIINKEYLDLNILTNNVLMLASVSATNKDIQLINNVNSDAKVHADPNLISAVIRNLVANSIKFTPNGGKIEIHTERVGSMIVVSVCDTGVGIAEEDIAKLFRLDVHHSTEGTSNESGTGLGLLLCKEFVGLNGGDITVESKINCGTTFSFTVPLSSEDFDCSH